jgi:hypothetical protein
MESVDWRQPSNAIFVAPTATNTALTVTLPKDVITRKSPLTKIPTTEGTYVLTSNFSTALLAGKSYNLNVKLRAAKWAGSNIYWDTDKLTFDEYGSTGNEGYQGVFFRFGSLVGIASMDVLERFDDDSPVYTPNESGGWTQGTVADFGSILCWDVSTHGSVLSNDVYPNLGDICKAIKPTYRLPKAEEFGASGYTVWGDVGAWVAKGGSYSGYGDGNAVAGTTDLIAANYLYAENATMGVRFPASGLYSFNSPDATFMNMYLYVFTTFYGYYWCGSPLDTAFYFYNTRPAVYNITGHAMSVRCVLDD